MKVKFLKDSGDFVSIEGTLYELDADKTCQMSPEHYAVAQSFGGEAVMDDEQEDPVDAILAEVLDGNIKEVEAALGKLSTSDLERLGKLESATHDRKGVHTAIALEIESRS